MMDYEFFRNPSNPNETLWQMLRRQGLEAQYNMLNSTFDNMRKDYHEARMLVEDKLAGIKAKEIAIEKSLLNIQFLTNSYDSFHDQIQSISGASNPQMKEFIHAYGYAYTLLLKEENPDDWLGQFLDTHPEFREDLGGYPEWLQRPSKDDRYSPKNTNNR